MSGDVPTHGAIILGGIGIMLLHSPIPLLIILVLVKIIIDVQLHLRSHQPTQQQPDDRIPVPSYRRCSHLRASDDQSPSSRSRR